MNSPQLSVELRLPFRWEARAHDTPTCSSLRQCSQLMLTALGLMEKPALREPSEDRGLERIEAKQDLILHLLGQTLSQGRPTAPETPLQLTAEGIAWTEDGPLPTAGAELVLELQAFELPLPLRLPAVVGAIEGQRVRALFKDMDEPLAEAWQQWLFRQHRRAIHAARGGL